MTEVITAIRDLDEIILYSLATIHFLLCLFWIVRLIIYIRKEKRKLIQQLQYDKLYYYYDSLSYNHQTHRVKSYLLMALLINDLAGLGVAILFSCESNLLENSISTLVYDQPDASTSLLSIFLLQHLEISTYSIVIIQSFLLLFLIILLTSYLRLRYAKQATKSMFVKYFSLFLVQSFFIFVLANPFTFILVAILTSLLFIINLVIIIRTRKSLIEVLRHKVVSESSRGAKEKYQIALHQYVWLSRALIIYLIALMLTFSYEIYFIFYSVLFDVDFPIFCHNCSYPLLPSNNLTTLEKVFSKSRLYLNFFDNEYIWRINLLLFALVSILPFLLFTLGHMVATIRNAYCRRYVYKYNYDMFPPALRPLLLRNK